MSNAPKYVVTTGFSYSPEIGSSGLSGLLYVDARYQSDTNTGSDLDQEKIQDGFLVVNGRIGLPGPDKKMEPGGFPGRTCSTESTSRLAQTRRARAAERSAECSPETPTSQLFIAFPGEPRTYGITVRGKF
ncbi:MAG: hypothetical protein IPI83_15810 [Sphingomonadales bacterium]|nr:hypothetical protein [Sphingomonadales bacterium]